MRALAIALFAAVLTGGPFTAAAQEPLSLSAIYSADVFQQDVIAMGKPVLDSGQDGEASDAEPDATVQQALNYAPSPEVEQRTRQKLFDSLVTSTSDPAVQEQIKQSVTTDVVWQQFNQVLNRAGYSTTNLADVTTAYYIIAWEVVNGPDATVHPAGVQAVHEDVVAAYAADPRLTDLTDADKQEAASIMAYMATIAAASANQLRSTGNQAGLETLQEQVHKAVLGQGLDLAQLRLTDQGFTAR
ncbi:MAG: DUF6683 family protein [Kiloniellaceae bacterium]